MHLIGSKSYVKEKEFYTICDLKFEIYIIYDILNEKFKFYLMYNVVYCILKYKMNNNFE